MVCGNCDLSILANIRYLQVRCQGKLLEGAKVPWGSRGQSPLVGTGAKPPEANTFLVIEALSDHMYFLV